MTHTRNPGYIPGNYWMECDRCGLDYRRSDIRKEWTGLYVCKDKCWEPRHPQDFVKSRKDDQSVPVARPPSPNVFVTKDDIDVG